ncbi:MAG TPA: hypothetical protein D7I05_06155 [Candidatus Poseidoniales archaeon]|nr:MAG TPA: hypothetical protein D7I05_06155 [Candidatus Poseidoniales archaeon]
MQPDPVSEHMIRLGMIRARGAAARAVAGGAAPRLRQVGLALLRADLRRAREALDASRLRGSGWFDWRHLPPHVVELAAVRARRLGFPSTRAVVRRDETLDGHVWLPVGGFRR